jgi:hypothetical protein
MAGLCEKRVDSAASLICMHCIISQLPLAIKYCTSAPSFAIGRCKHSRAPSEEIGCPWSAVKVEIVGFEFLMAVSTKMAVFWVVALCSLVEIYQRFRGPCCLHHQS